MARPDGWRKATVLHSHLRVSREFQDLPGALKAQFLALEYGPIAHLRQIPVQYLQFWDALFVTELPDEANMKLPVFLGAGPWQGDRWSPLEHASLQSLMSRTAEFPIWKTTCLRTRSEQAWRRRQKRRLRNEARSKRCGEIIRTFHIHQGHSLMTKCMSREEVEHFSST